MSGFRLRLLLAVPLAAALFVGACGGGNSNSPDRASGSVPSEPRSGGTLTLLNQTETRSLDPTKMQIITSTRGDGLVGFALYGGLVLQDPATGKVSMSMAQSLDSTDSRVWTLKLRSGLRFSDGTTLDAAAVKFNWERHAAPGSTSSALTLVREIVSTEVVDPLTLRVTLDKPNGQWPRSLAGYPSNFIASPKSLTGNPDTAPVGAGPFVLKDWVRDDHMTLVRNPSYFDAPRPYLNELIIRPIPDATQRYNSLVAGQGQILYDSVDFKAMATAEKGGYKIFRTDLGGGFTFVLNTSRAPMNDVRVRQAIEFGLDRDVLNDLVNQGRANIVDTIAAPDTPFHDPAITYPKPDRGRAQRLIDQVVHDTGKPVTFTILTNPQNQSTAEAIQTLLSEIKGFKISVSTMDSTQATVVQGNYDMAPSGTFFVDPEPKLWDQFHSGSPRNVTRYSNPKVDAALDTARSSQNVDERRAAYAVVQRALIDDEPVLSLWRLPSSLVHDRTVQNLHTIEDGVLRADLVWLSE